MKKEEILEKSRNEIEDEGITNTENKGLQYGLIALLVVFVLITVFSIALGKGNLLASYAASSMILAFLSANCIPKYKFTKKKSLLVASICYIIATICAFLSFIITLVD